MALHPILAALTKHKAGVFLVGLQIALTLAIVCNIIFIVGQRVQRIHRPTGLIESNLFLIAQRYVGAPTGDDHASLEKLDAMQMTDLAVLRASPDVQSATPVNSLPLLRTGLSGEVALKPGQQHGVAEVNSFTGDEDFIKTLGLRLIAGRNFTSTEMDHHGLVAKYRPSVVIVSKSLAAKLFPNGDALGKPLYIGNGTKPSIIVGIVERLLTPAPDEPESDAWNSLIMPTRIDRVSTMYAVRAKPGRMREAMREAQTALFKADPMRVIPQGGRYNMEGIHTFGQIRAWGYALDLFMVQVLTVICVILLAITGIGITGLTSFWVNQRRKQIGIRRALGARKIDILRYFQIENLVIAGGGCIVGVVLAVGINLVLLQIFQMDRMPAWYVIGGVIVILALGQIAVFAPARRASNVPPLVATRSV